MEDRIEKSQWLAFLDDFSKTHHGYEARLEIVGREFGDQEEASWLPFSGMSHDPHHDQIIITVGGISSHYPVHLTHTISKPEQLTIVRPPDKDELSVVIVAPDAVETLVHLRRQLQLPT